MLVLSSYMSDGAEMPRAPMELQEHHAKWALAYYIHRDFHCLGRFSREKLPRPSIQPSFVVFLWEHEIEIDRQLCDSTIYHP
jgi:hypothetical protein